LRLVLAVVGVLLLTEQSLAIRKIARNVNERVYGFDRLVNASVEIEIIRVRDNGPILLDSGRRAEVVDVIRSGGIIDTKLEAPAVVGWKSPITWRCSEDQAPIILHAGPELGHLVIGSEGAGKTTALAMWHALRWFENLGERREGGQTAPTLKRLGLVKDEVLKLWPAQWRQWADRDDFLGFELCDGSRVRFVSTAPRPERQGSPIQGFNWSWCGRDEMQDQVAVHPDIESRGRAAKNGQYKQLGTATAKDDPEWRTFRDGLLSGGAWSSSRLLVERSPFVAANFLDVKRRSGMTDREFRRRYLAEDLPPESRLYFNWSREHNLRPLPLVGGKLITSIVLRAKTGNPNHALLIGHDPGIAKSASVFLQAWKLPGEPDPCWWVRGELFTMHQTTEQHACAVLERTRALGYNVPRFAEIADVRAQPIGQAEDKPDLDVYRIFKRVGLDIRAAQYRKDGTGTGHIDREMRIGMVNMLLCDVLGRRRLFVECDDRRQPVAPRLVEAFESIERDDRGRIGSDKRLTHDRSDCPDALGYALWPYEKAGASELRAGIRGKV
jgi:hypothetical protein